MNTSKPERSVRIAYTNHRGEHSVRTVHPLKLWFGETNWHPEPQWFVDCHDIEKNQVRSFAMRDIRSWDVKDG